MPNLPFLKVYCTAEFRDEVHELARLNDTAVSRLVLRLLEEDVDIERRLMEARARESHRLALLQEKAAHDVGQIDFIANGKGEPTGRERRERSERRPPGPQGKRRGKRRRKAVGARSRGAR
jgi:hypothetical protein